MATCVYIDGFNLYHGLIRTNRLHWLNIEQLGIRLNSGHAAAKILYCTAMVSGTPDDPEKAMRQSAYHQALRAACPTVEIIFGNFTTHAKNRPVAGCRKSPSCVFQIMERNEKGSDVNLATRLMHDAHLKRFDRAIVVSGDSDLAEPIRIVRDEIKKEIWVRNPYDRESKELKSVCSDYSHLSVAILRKSQFADPLRINGKMLHKPPHWSNTPPAVSRVGVHSATCPDHGCSTLIKTCRYL